MERPIIRRTLPCKLTLDEFDDRAARLTALGDEIEIAEAREKERAKLEKERIGSMVVHERELRAVVRDRLEPRGVDCQWSPDWSSKSMLLRRLDTLEVVEARTMTPDELQLSIDDVKRDLDSAEPQ